MSRSEALVSADWVEQNLNTPGVVLVEVDEDTAAYDTGHIAGAVKLDWKADLQDPVVRDALSKEDFEKLLSAKGIGNDDTVVLYGGNNNWFAAYAYWYFKLYGHSRRQAARRRPQEVGAGGPRAVQGRGVAPGDRVPRPGPGHLDPGVPRRGDRRDRHQEPGGRPLARRVLRQAAGPGAPAAGAVPARRPHPDRGERAVVQGGQRGRHLQVRRRADQALRRRGLDTSKDTIAYCRIGERSSHTWFVLHELLGHPNVKNYDGSWTEYGSLIGVPIEKG